MKEILQMEMTRWILGRRLGLYNLTSRKRKPYNQPTAEGEGVRIFFWTILVVLTLSLSSLCILLDSCRPR